MCLIKFCLEPLEELDRENRVTLAGVPGHRDHEEANSLGQEGASEVLFGLFQPCNIQSSGC